MAAANKLVQDCQQPQNDDTHLAPLASLDCSISEPNMATPASIATASTVTTPTLSGYFDCDQLSDMIDDSLFELTNAGCLSKSVFSGGGGGRRPLAPEEETFEEEEEGEEEEQQQEVSSVQVTPTTGNSEQPPQTSQVAMLAIYKAYDYSSTSTIPTSLTKPPATGARIASINSRCSNADKTTATRNSNNNIINNLLPAVATKRPKPAKPDLQLKQQQQQQQQQRAHRKYRSNPDVSHDNSNNNCCPDCQQGREQQQQRLSSSGARNVGGSKKKKRFTFSLFNLFTGNEKGSPEGDLIDEKICIHMGGQKQQQPAPPTKLAANQSLSLALPTATSKPVSAARERKCRTKRRQDRGNGSGNNEAGAGAGSVMIQSKARDSIRITNQRKQRNSAAAAKSLNTISDSQAEKNNNKAELLLDFSNNSNHHHHHHNNQLQLQQQQQRLIQGDSAADVATASHHQLPKPKQSHSSYSIRDYRYQPAATKDNNSSGGGGELQPGSQKLVKSVKFTMHDRIMILPTFSAAKGSSSLATGSRSSGHLPTTTATTTTTTTTDLQPIIKRPIPKSSSYSQTESNKSLEEMLARYEGNRELIVEINEKLKLTETIASPKSALDKQQQTSHLLNDANVMDINNNNNNQTFSNHDNHHHHVSSSIDSDALSSPLAPGNYHVSTKKQQPYSSGLVEAADDAGFSRDWLQKQRALV